VEVNTELAMAALADAKANPDRFNMNTFFSMWPRKAIVKDSENFLPPCGTTACFAGFAALRVAPLGAKVVDGFIIHEGQGLNRHVEPYATKALGPEGGPVNCQHCGEQCRKDGYGELVHLDTGFYGAYTGDDPKHGTLTHVAV
jgi:hypothetical protein